MAALFFGMAFVTDFLDGYFARRYGAVTVIGKILDPLADKILVIVTMIMMIPIGRIPAWIVMLIVVRELAVTGLRSIAVTEGSGHSGKHSWQVQDRVSVFGDHCSVPSLRVPGGRPPCGGYDSLVDRPNIYGVVRMDVFQ